MSPIHIRAAAPDDTDSMVKVRIDTWRSAYQGILPEDYLANLSYEQTAQRWREMLWETPQAGIFAYVAVADQDQIVGIAVGGHALTQDPVYHGEVYIIYVLQEYQNQGIGRNLIGACAQRLLEDGINSLLIWVIAANPYRQFYEALGGTAVREKEEETGGKMILEIGYGWQDLHRLLVAPDSNK